MARLIDADVLKKAILAEPWKNEPNIVRLTVDYINIIIDEQPTVDAVEVVHGWWVHPKGYVVSNGFLCSECNHEEASHHPIHPLGNGSCKADEHGNFFYPPKINYCPNCGAYMRERKDNEYD